MPRYRLSHFHASLPPSSPPPPPSPPVPASSLLTFTSDNCQIGQVAFANK